MNQKKILDAVHVLTREMNYDIIQDLPNDVLTLMSRFNLSRMPMNKRINDLERVGLLKRKRGVGSIKGEIEATEIALELISKLKVKDKNDK